MSKTQVNFRVDESKWHAFKEKATSLNSSATAELDRLIDLFIAGDIQGNIQRIDDEIYNRITELSKRLNQHDDRLNQHDDRLKKLSA